MNKQLKKKHKQPQETNKIIAKKEQGLSSRL